MSDKQDKKYGCKEPDCWCANKEHCAAEQKNAHKGYVNIKEALNGKNNKF